MPRQVTPRRRVTATPPAPATVTRVNPLVMQAARRLAGGDPSRIEILAADVVRVRNRARRT